MKAIITLTNVKVIHNFSKSKNIIVMLLIAILIWDKLKPIKEFSVLTNESVPIWIFSLFYTSPTQATNVLKTLLILAFVFTVSDVPFHTKMDTYLRQRIHYRGWITSYLLQGLYSAILYNLFINILIIICSFPHITFEAKWGKLISTLTYSSSYSQYKGELLYTPSIISNFDPILAWLHTFFLEILVLYFLYLIMLLIRMLQANEWLGQLVAIFFICIDWVICYMDISYTYWFSPVSLSSIQIYYHRNTNMPDIIQSYILILLLDVILCSLVFLKGASIDERGISQSS